MNILMTPQAFYIKILLYKEGAIMILFGEKLKELRQIKNLTQLELSNRLHVTKSMISAYENGIRYPSYDVLIKIANLFGVTTDYLLGLDNRKYIDLTNLTNEQNSIVSSIVSEFNEINKKQQF